MNAIYALSVAGAVVAAGDLALAQWSRSGQPGALLLGLALNVAGIMLYALTLGTGSVGIATAIFLGINIASVALGGFFLFGDSISAARLAALVLLASSIMLVEVV